jgi:hypothetical protein
MIPHAPLHVHSIASAAFSALCTALVVALNASAAIGFTLAAVNALAALLTGYGTYRMSKERRAQDAKMDEMDGHTGSRP